MTGSGQRTTPSLVAPGLACHGESATEAGEHPILEEIGRQREIRFFVDGTRNFGHQAASIRLLDRLVEQTGFAGRITIIFRDATCSGHGSTREKLAYLLPGLDPGQIESVKLAREDGTLIDFLPYDRRNELEHGVEFGFTGGCDDMTINFASELKVRFFMRLQPYLWDDDSSRRDDPYYECSRLEESGGGLTELADEVPGLRQLACRIATRRGGRPSPATWAWYGSEQTFDPGLRVRTRNASALVRGIAARPGQRLWCWYGLHHFHEQIAEMTLNLVLAAFLAQEKIHHPIVAVSLNAGSHLPGFSELLGALAEDLAAQRAELPALSAAAGRLMESRRVTSETMGSITSGIGSRAARWIEDSSRLTVLEGFDRASGKWIDLAPRIENSLRDGGNHDVTVILLGHIPADVFDHLLTHSHIPPIFEGQETASLLIARGCPFLQVPREGHVIESGYPTALGGTDFSVEAAQALEAARRLRLRPFSGSDGTRPSDLLAELESTSRFIQDLEEPTSPVRRYFEEMRRFSEQHCNDKLLAALEVLEKRRGADLDSAKVL